MVVYCEMKNVLITSVGKRVVLVEIFKRSFKELGLDAKVFTTDMRPDLAPACFKSDGYFKVSGCTADSYVDELLDICHDKNIGVVIPTIDTELTVLASKVERFRKADVFLMLSDLDFIRLCEDKRLSSFFLKRIGMSVPKLVDRHHPVFPLFVKPYNKSRSENAYVVTCQDELTRKILADPDMLFMEYVDKKEYKEFTVDMYYGRDNRIKGIVPRERIVIRAGEVNKAITRKNSIVGFLKERMNSLEGVRGCICIQLFYRERDHDIIGIEINPRFGGGFPLSYYAGANFAEYVIREYLQNEDIEYSENWLGNTLMLRYDNDLIIYDAGT